MTARQVTPDLGRQIISRPEFVAAHFGAAARPPGHGFVPAGATTGQAYAAHDHGRVRLITPRHRRRVRRMAGVAGPGSTALAGWRASSPRRTGRSGTSYSQATTRSRRSSMQRGVTGATGPGGRAGLAAEPTPLRRAVARRAHPPQRRDAARHLLAGDGAVADRLAPADEIGQPAKGHDRTAHDRRHHGRSSRRSPMARRHRQPDATRRVVPRTRRKCLAVAAARPGRPPAGRYASRPQCAVPAARPLAKSTLPLTTSRIGR